MEEAKQAWGEGQFTHYKMKNDEIAAANMAAVENVQFCNRIINMEYDDYLRAMEKN